MNIYMILMMAIIYKFRRNPSDNEWNNMSKDNINLNISMNVKGTNIQR